MVEAHAPIHMRRKSRCRNARKVRLKDNVAGTRDRPLFADGRNSYHLLEEKGAIEFPGWRLGKGLACKGIYLQMKIRTFGRKIAQGPIWTVVTQAEFNPRAIANRLSPFIGNAPRSRMKSGRPLRMTPGCYRTVARFCVKRRIVTITT